MIQQLPAHLRERTRSMGSADLAQDGEYVLYWMHHAVRGHENPPLDVAVSIGNGLGIPVLVYQGLGGAHRFNSDRHHTFTLEGARDVHLELATRGIAYAFHLDRHPGARSPLRRLLKSAAAVVTEDYPAPPFPVWSERLAHHFPGPFLAVDASCIVPVQWHGKAYSRAYEFRSASRRQFERRVTAPWMDVEPEVGLYAGSLPFEPIDLPAVDIAELCASCRIDHTIGPVHHTLGGSTAGYARWQEFKEIGLRSYARLRNDAAIAPPRGVSRLSPYIHHGHVSPFRIAREAAADGSPGAEKFLDELLIWRELAFNLCFHNNNLESLDVLPDWARKTLVGHARDTREHTYSLETLARAKTGDVLWDLAQKSLTIHGELHNNVRMTWGKALVEWTESPGEALRTLIDLNHRYALDGSDPNSYGGLLWCLGMFDRPFSPERQILGSVRPRSTEAHAKRLDIHSYRGRVLRAARSNALRVGIVGAGMAGLIAGRTLSDHSYEVRLFDKARGAGGRMASRRREGLTFDHGAQYFVARDPRFRRYVDAWKEEGVVSIWDGRFGAVEDGQYVKKIDQPVRYVGAPRMSALTRHLAEDLDIVPKKRVTRAVFERDYWQLYGEEDMDLGRYDVLLVTIPPSQAAELLMDSGLVDQLQDVRMLPCWAVMVTFRQRIEIGYDGLFVSKSPLSWVARNSGKPDRSEREAWVLHAGPDWSAQNLEREPESVAPELLEAFWLATGQQAIEPESLVAHRWRFALAENPLSTECLWDGTRLLGIGGDWCAGSRVEGAFLSGAALAGRVMGIPDTGSNVSNEGQTDLFD